MKTAKLAKVTAGVCALVIAAATLSGCEAKPGAAAYNSKWTITEQEIAQVSSELPEVFSVQRSQVLLQLLLLKYGAQKQLSSCPSWGEISAQLADALPVSNPSTSTKDVIRLALCQNQNSQGIQKAISDAESALLDDNSFHLSDRYVSLGQQIEHAKASAQAG